jgi:hypothetical protein
MAVLRNINPLVAINFEGTARIDTLLMSPLETASK